LVYHNSTIPREGGAMTAGRTEDTASFTTPGAARGSAQPDQAEAEVARRLAEARERLERRAGLTPPPTVHYRREEERPFTAEERDHVTILIGGLTARHEQLIQAILGACGHKCQPVPQADLSACMVGKQYGNNGLCNPAYFTVGSLVKHLQELEAGGMSRQDIVDRHVFFTAGGCGPCRFGMYEGEYRLALRNAGFDGFRILTFQQGDGVKANTGEAGLKLTLLLGLGALNAFQVADVINDFSYAIRPYEVIPGSTNRQLDAAMQVLADDFRARQRLDPATKLPGWLWTRLSANRVTRNAVEVLLNMREHLYGPLMTEAMRRSREHLELIEVDRLRVKPVVKVTGEFWAQSTEGDGNFRMFEFLEREGAQVVVDPISTWLMYLLRQEHARVLDRRGVDVPRTGPWSARFKAWRNDELKTLGKRLGFSTGNAIYRHRYHRLCKALGDVPHHLVDQEALAKAAHPFYHHLARGGEGHLEVGKNILYSTQNAAHMVLSLKPFGCMPSTQSDGVQSTVAAKVKNVLFLPIETAAEGELHAHSRVQMVLVEARQRAEEEFDRALASTGKKLNEIRRYVDDHRELRSPFHHVPVTPGIAGVAANFVLHVSQLIDHDGAWRSRPVVSQPGLRTSANQQMP
jgi:predicted nucleotide-binding protein (sugar kinase/HSP70/actin superfamily)